MEEKKYLDYHGLVQVFNIMSKRDSLVEESLTEMLNDLSKKITDLENSNNGGSNGYTKEEADEKFVTKELFNSLALRLTNLENKVKSYHSEPAKVMLNGEPLTEEEFEIKNYEDVNIAVESETPITSYSIKVTDKQNVINLSGLNLTNEWLINDYDSNYSSLRNYINSPDYGSRNKTSYNITLSKDLIEILSNNASVENENYPILEIEIVNEDDAVFTSSLKLPIFNESISEDKLLLIKGGGRIDVNANGYADSKTFIQGRYDMSYADSLPSMFVSSTIYGSGMETLTLPNYAFLNTAFEKASFNSLKELTLYNYSKSVNASTSLFTLPTVEKINLGESKITISTSTASTLTIFNGCDNLQQIEGDLSFEAAGGSPLKKINHTVDASSIKNYDILKQIINANVIKGTGISNFYLKVNSSLYSQANTENSSISGKWTVQSA